MLFYLLLSKEWLSFLKWSACQSILIFFKMLFQTSCQGMYSCYKCFVLLEPIKTLVPSSSLPMIPLTAYCRELICKIQTACLGIVRTLKNLSHPHKNSCKFHFFPMNTDCCFTIILFSSVFSGGEQMLEMWFGLPEIFFTSGRFNGGFSWNL